MCWIEKSKSLFACARPDHFADYKHCEECAEHDQTLRQSSIDSIGIKELGNPGWDPMCFCSVEGKKYFMPSLIRLSLETINDDFYLEQFIFHLEYNGKENELYLSCSKEQRKLIASFIESMIEGYASEIEKELATDSVLAAYEIWSQA